MDYMLFIKKYRLLNKMTQHELALKSKLGQSYISQLETNCPRLKSPTLLVISNIAKALNVCPHALVRFDLKCNYDCFKKCSVNFFD